MAITTIDGAIAGMQWPRQFTKATIAPGAVGRPTTLWASAGNPGAGAYDTTLNGVALSSTSTNVNGQLPWTDPGAGNSYLARLSGVNSASGGVLILCDRLWHNGGFTITSATAQSITFPTLPSRDASGATNGDGVLIAVEVSATVGAAAPTFTMSYTNSAGTSGKTATNIDASVSGGLAGLTYRMSLAAGDIGVRSVQSLTMSASQVSGTINLVAYRPLAQIELAGAVTPAAIDALTSGFPRMYNGTVPFFQFIPSVNTAGVMTGTAVWTQG